MLVFGKGEEKRKAREKDRYRFGDRWAPIKTHKLPDPGQELRPPMVPLLQFRFEVEITRNKVLHLAAPPGTSAPTDLALV